ncbi:MAG: DegT/DnrJ/EryC1/StrS family aminotransferase [Clostridia bacterium]
MEFIDLKAQYKHLKDKIDENIQKVLYDSHYIMGEEVKILEEKLAKYVGRKYCATCANGTDALTIAMKVLNVRPGDAVFVPTFTFYATAEVVSLEGATPIFIDVDARTFNMDATKLEKAIKQVIEEGKLTPKAVIPVDLFGQVANFPDIVKIAKKYNLKVVEDAAQGFGGEINGRKACSFGDISTTSFFPAKPLGCYGDGGAIFTDDEEMYQKILSIRVHGKGSFKYENVRIGLNSRLDTIQAAILLPKLEAFEEYELEERNKFAKMYAEKLKGIVKTPVVPDGYVSSWAQYTLILENEEERNAVQAKLKEKGIPTMIYYPIPLHKQIVYQDYSFNLEDLKVSENLSSCVLSIPMHPYLNEETVNKVTNAITEILR